MAAIGGALGLGMLAYGVVFSIMYGLLNTVVLLSFWVCWQSWALYRSAKNDRLKDHPLFMNYEADAQTAYRV